MTLVEFLLARVAEEDAAAHAEMVRRHHQAKKKWNLRDDPRPSGWIVGVGAPDRILLECEAKRRIIQPWLYDGNIDVDDWCYDMNDAWERNLRALALPYEGHRDFQPEWEW